MKQKINQPGKDKLSLRPKKIKNISMRKGNNGIDSMATDVEADWRFLQIRVLKFLILFSLFYIMCDFAQKC